MLMVTMTKRNYVCTQRKFIQCNFDVETCFSKLLLKKINASLMNLKFKITSLLRPVARIESGEVWNPPKVDLLDPKSGLFEPHPSTLLQKPHFWLTLWPKVDLLPDLHPPGYGPELALHIIFSRCSVIKCDALQQHREQVAHAYFEIRTI